MRFSPNCGCCAGTDCVLCDNGTVKQEYDVTFFPGTGDQFTLTVSYGGSTVDDSGAFGCCNWLYVGTLNDFPGFFDDGNGPCGGGDTAKLSLVLQREKPIEVGEPCEIWNDEWIFYWWLRILVPCDPENAGSDRGEVFATGGNAVKFTGENDVSLNESVDCSLTGANLLTFSGWGNDDVLTDCDGPVVNDTCFDCTGGLGPIVCDFPSGGAEVENAS